LVAFRLGLKSWPQGQLAFDSTPIAPDRRERTGRLGISRDHLTSHHAGSELDAIPHQRIRWHKPREARQCPASQPITYSFEKRPGEPVHGAHVAVRAPGRDLTGHDAP
jgi:hypothetical protein